MPNVGNGFASKRLIEPELPLRLRDALKLLTVEEMRRVKRLLDMREAKTGGNRQAVVESVAAELPEGAARLTQLWDSSRWELLRTFIRNDGLISSPKFSPLIVEYMRERALAFPAEVKGKPVLVMPVELVERLKEMEGLAGIPDLVRKNTERIKLTQGLLYYYGVLPETELERMLEELAGPYDEERDLFEMIVDAIGCYDAFVVDDDGIFRFRDVEDPEAVLSEQEMRSGLDYRPFTRAQLLEASEPGFVERTQAYLDLVRFFTRNYKIERGEADLIADLCADEFKSGKSLSDAFGIVQHHFEFRDEADVSAVVDILVAMNNSTRQWVLKGYSPSELSAARAKSVPANVLAAPPSARQGDVISFKTGQKIGRNDPCPCGSGKKFKKCCGSAAN